MTYLEGISSILNKEYLVSGVKLIGEADCSDIEIRGRFTIIKTDQSNFVQNVITCLFNPGPARSICDYVIVSDSVILICELKSKNTTGKNIQLRNTGRLVKYLLQMVKEHHNITAQIPAIKYVGFASKYTGKQMAQPKKLPRVIWEDSELFNLPCNTSYSLSQFN